MIDNFIVAVDEKRDGAVPVAAAQSNAGVGIAFPICFIVGLLFLIGGAIAIGLIPIYLSDGDSPSRTSSTSAPNTNPSLLFYAVTDQNQLLSINARNPSVVLSTVSLTGLNAGDSVSHIDFRPAMGTLYGTGRNQLYVINETTGAARTVGGLVSSTEFGNIVSMEFIPENDVLRIVTTTGATVIINPETGEILGRAPTKNETGVSVAFDNNFSGATTSTLYIINAASDALVRQNLSDSLTDIKVGSGFGIDITDGLGFDISPNGLALACVKVGNARPLYLVDLTSGTFSAYLGLVSQSIVTLAIPTAQVAYAITSADKKLLYINSLASGLSFVSKAIIGLDAGETIQSLDIRPMNGQLFGLSSNNILYLLDPGVAEAFRIGSAAVAPVAADRSFSIEVNPVVDRIRVLSTAGDNLRVNPDTGVPITDTNLSPTTSRISLAAYTNNFVGASSTVLYDIDLQAGQLFTQAPPNSGTLNSVGSLGLTSNEMGGFDIGGKSGIAVAVLTVNSVTNVYRIDLNSGKATSVANTIFPEKVIAYTLSLNV